MRRAAFAIATTALGLVLLLGFKTHPASAPAGQPPAATSAAAPQTGGSGSSGAAQSGAAQSGAGGSGPSPASSAPSGNRVVTGAAVDTRYGPVQLQVTLSNGKITKIDVLQAPFERPRDVEINNYALPILTQEALAAQSATIDMVSGATYTSQGYIGSLQSALDGA
jgi:uncharacterized protein with FMN-binding domain